MKNYSEKLKILLGLEVILLLALIACWFFPDYFAIDGIEAFTFASIVSIILGIVGLSGTKNIEEKSVKLLRKVSIIFIVLGIAIFILPYAYLGYLVTQAILHF